MCYSSFENSLEPNSTWSVIDDFTIIRSILSLAWILNPWLVVLNVLNLQKSKSVGHCTLCTPFTGFTSGWHVQPLFNPSLQLKLKLLQLSPQFLLTAFSFFWFRLQSKIIHCLLGVLLFGVFYFLNLDDTSPFIFFFPLLQWHFKKSQPVVM